MMTYNKENDLLTDIEQMYSDVLVICRMRKTTLADWRWRKQWRKYCALKPLASLKYEVTINDNHLNENHEILQRFLVTMHQSLPLVTMSL